LQSVRERVTFNDRVSHFLERVEYRRADTPEEKDAIYRLRHEAYTRDGSVERRPSGLFDDEFDQTPNAWLIGVFIDGDLAASMRLHISASLSVPLPATLVYPDIVNPYLRAGRVMIDGSRMVSKAEYSRRFAEMPYVTMRPTFLAEDYFDADYMTAASRVEYQSFYKRVCAAVAWAEPRAYPNFNPLMAFVGRDCRSTRTRVLERYPFFRSEPEERERLFGRSSNVADDVMKAIGRSDGAGVAAE
jgi:hypothetical protein